MKDKKRVSGNKPKRQDDGAEFATPSARELEKMLGITDEELHDPQELSGKPVLTGECAVIMAFADEFYERAQNGDVEAEELLRSLAQALDDAVEKVRNESGDTDARDHLEG